MIKKLTIVFLMLMVLFGQQSELKNVKLLPFEKKREVVSYMKIVTKELGVKCSFVTYQMITQAIKKLTRLLLER